MREKMYAMMKILVDKCLAGENILGDEREMTNLLQSSGFQPEDIYDAVGWLQQSATETREAPDIPWECRRHRAVRVMHPEEYLAYTPAAQGLLHRLYNGGVIDDQLREEIIQRCIDINEDEIDTEQVKTITLLVMFKERHEAPGNAVLRLFEDEPARLPD